MLRFKNKSHFNRSVLRLESFHQRVWKKSDDIDRNAAEMNRDTTNFCSAAAEKHSPMRNSTTGTNGNHPYGPGFHE